MKLLVISLFMLLITGLVYAAEPTSKIEESQKGEFVGNETCPVSGERIDENMKVTYEYKGKVYNFCCQGCVEEFKRDPEKYIEKIEKEGIKKGGEHHHHHEHHH